MKVSWRWLHEYVDLPGTPRELAARLTMAGLEAEKIEEIGADWDPDFVRVARVKEVRAIPGAERVVQALLALPEREAMVVTGAPNIAAGQKIAFAQIGARLYDGHRDDHVLRTLKPRAIMGITGEGMVCSEKELGVSEEHEGILVLPEDAPIGVPLVEYLGDTIIEFEITPNLVHDYSIIGVAREAAAVLGTRFRDPLPRWDATPLDAPEIPGLVTVEDTKGCPRFSALVIEHVTVAPSPEWMQRRLLSVGMRPVNNIVDASNYVMLEYGQPTHPFDRDRLAGGQLIVRHARPGETLELINHEERTLDPEMLAVCDEAGVVSIGAIIGGVRSEITDETRTVLLEAANWDMRNIRHTRQRLNLRTDASARFERGLEPQLTMPAARRIAELIQSFCPEARVTGWADTYPAPPTPRSVSLRYGKIGAVLGTTYPLDRVTDVLTRLQFGVEVSSDDDPLLTVAVPPHRSDVSRPEDIIEEVARVIGYETLPATLLTGTVPHVIRTDRWIAREAARDALASAGVIEIATYSFTSARELDALAAAGGTPAADVPTVRLANTMGEWEAMRPTLRGSLLSTASENMKFVSGVAIGEIANVYLPRESGELPDERLTLCIVLAGRDHDRTLGIEPREYDFFDLKGMIEAILPALGVENMTFMAVDDLVFQPGRAARITVGGGPIGVLGEVHPRVVAAFGLHGRVMLAELDLEANVASVAARRSTLRQLPPISRYPATDNDFTFTLDDHIAAGDVAAAIKQAIGPLGKDVRLLDVYRGAPIPHGKKSLSFAVMLQAPDRALSEAEVTKIRDRIIQTVGKRFGATLRVGTSV